MIFLMAMMILVTVNTASAQMWDTKTKIVPITNKATGEKIGYMVISGNRIYMRDKHNEHYATVVREPDGSKKFFDPSGNPIDPSSVNIPVD